jgi:hypothetical protein
MKAMRSSLSLRDLPLCHYLVVYTDLSYLYDAAVNADRALLGLPPLPPEDAAPEDA